MNEHVAAAASDYAEAVSRLTVTHRKRPSSFFARKYVLDRLLGTVLLVLTSPVLLLLFLVVKLTSPGPGFYRQTRVGLHGKTFEIIKLRSMVKNAEKRGRAVWCVRNDSRITPVGRILRKLHLDELPQLWNVARGDMSLVGPRPERPEICEVLAQKIEDYYQRVAVNPGVTGLAQINLPPDQTFCDAQRKQVLDLHYIDTAGPWLELRILIATAMRICGIKGETVMRSMALCRRHLLIDHLLPAPPQEARSVTKQPSRPSDEADALDFSLEDSGVLL